MTTTRRGRPKLDDPVIFNVKLVLRPGVDDDLIAYLSAAPARGLASAVKTAMRSGTLEALVVDVDEDEMINALDDLVI